jgi:heme O synthase-like polyprenyltransferase
VYLFAIIFFWTPPHFWALSLLIQRDYRRANVPMLPVVTNPNYTALHIFLYSLALVGLTIMFALMPHMGWVYLGTAVVLGGAFIWYAWRLKQESSLGAAPSRAEGGSLKSGGGCAAVRRNARKLYLGTAVVLGGAFIWYAWRLKQESSLGAAPSRAEGGSLKSGGGCAAVRRNARKLYLYSLLYLALLFAAVMVDSVV